MFESHPPSIVKVFLEEPPKGVVFILNRSTVPEDGLSMLQYFSSGVVNPVM
jgi:hypothetical protein